MVKFLAGVAGVCALALSSRMVEAAPLVYTIDPAQSSLHIQIFAQDPNDATNLVPVSLPQTPGSDTSALSGTILADTTGGNIALTANNNIQFANQALPQGPAANGGIDSPGAPFDGDPSPPFTGLPSQPNAGLETANYGLQLIVFNDPTDPLDVYNAAILGLSAISNALGAISGTSPLSGGSFNAAPLSLTVANGNLAYNLNLGDGTPLGPTGANLLPPGTTNIGGTTSPMDATVGNGSVMTVGPLQTITIPVSVTVVENVSIATLYAVFTGTVVASAVVVPEPSTFALAGFGALALIPVIRRRLRKA